jgi:hypothetical protein
VVITENYLEYTYPADVLNGSGDLVEALLQVGPNHEAVASVDFVQLPRPRRAAPEWVHWLGDTYGVALGRGADMIA